MIKSQNISLKFIVGCLALASISACSSSGSSGTSPLTLADLPEYEAGASLDSPDTAITASSDGSYSSASIVSFDEETGTAVVEVGGNQYTFTRAVEVDGVVFSDESELAIISGEAFGAPAGEFSVVTAFVEGSNLGTSDANVNNVQTGVGGYLTPVADLPAMATYSGDFSAIRSSDLYVDTGTFTATATFGTTNTITGTASQASTQIATFDGDITGNTFDAEVTGDAINGNMQGGFFGPAAEEIAGVGSVTTGTGDTSVIAISGTQN